MSTMKELDDLLGKVVRACLDFKPTQSVAACEEIRAMFAELQPTDALAYTEPNSRSSLVMAELLKKVMAKA